MITEGGDFVRFLEELKSEYKKANLTIGGVADMLGIAFGCLLARSDISLGDITAPDQKAVCAPVVF
jgi:triphosphoribosyl-dephospho-CoA synthase